MSNQPKKIKETARHLSAFCEWYALERNYDASKTKLGVTKNTLADWIKKYNWHERADALDKKAFTKLEAKVVEAKAKRTAEMIENHFNYGAALVSIGAKYLKEKGVDNGGQAVQAIKIGVDVQRTAEGMATKKIDFEDVSKLTDEQLQSIVQE
jgi:transposase